MKARLLALILAVFALVPGLSRADTSTMVAPFQGGYTYHAQSTGLLGARWYSISTKQSATTDGSFSTFASLSNKIGGEIPYVTSGYASSQAGFNETFNLPAGVNSLTLTANIHIDDAHVTQGNRLGGNDATAEADGGLWASFNCECFLNQSGGGFSVNGNDSVSNSDITMSDTISDFNGNTLPSGPMVIQIKFGTNAFAGLRKSEAEAGISGTLSSISITTS
ncbi:MAG: hypothetical protein ACYDCC_10065 [Actinomycetota bacterium]